MTYYGDEAFPALSDEQWARLQAYGSAQEVESGALLWGAGEATYDLIREPTTAVTRPHLVTCCHDRCGQTARQAAPSDIQPSG